MLGMVVDVLRLENFRVGVCYREPALPSSLFVLEYFRSVGPAHAFCLCGNAQVTSLRPLFQTQLIFAASVPKFLLPVYERLSPLTRTSLNHGPRYHQISLEKAARGPRTAQDHLPIRSRPHPFRRGA